MRDLGQELQERHGHRDAGLDEHGRHQPDEDVVDTGTQPEVPSDHDRERKLEEAEQRNEHRVPYGGVRHLFDQGRWRSRVRRAADAVFILRQRIGLLDPIGDLDRSAGIGRRAR